MVFRVNHIESKNTISKLKQNKPAFILNQHQKTGYSFIIVVIYPKFFNTLKTFDMSQKKILVTGASSGFGKLSINTLLSKGHIVAASMRQVNGKNKENAEELSKAGAHIVELDVCDEKSVNDGMQDAIDKMGGLDVIVNNAGVGVAGMQEHFNVEEFQKVFDVNVFGVQRVNRAALPFLRKQGSGLIIYVTSLLGRVTMPFYGPYNASKWAMEAMAENYRIELSGFGVDNCIVEPGGFPTNFFGKLIYPSDQSRNGDYGDFMNVPKQFGDSFSKALESNPEQNPQLVADAISLLVNTVAGQRPFRTTVDKMGMGDPISAYNIQQEQITQGIFKNFRMEDMLKLKVK